MRLTYDEALASIIDHTEIGYTVASQDRLWIVFTFDLDSEGEHASLRYNRLYPLVNTEGEMVGGWSYDLTVHSRDRQVPVFTTRAEAEHFAMTLRHAALVRDNAAGVPDIYVMNLGDDARYEASIIGRDNGARTRTTPKFKGSESAWAAMDEMTQRWREANLR
jgi:hypothetical protein